MMKLLRNSFLLHKLYGFLLLNTCLVVFIPSLIPTSRVLIFGLSSYEESLPYEVIIAFVLSLLGIVISILFILKKKIAINLLTYILLISIIIIIAYMMIFLSSELLIDDSETLWDYIQKLLLVFFIPGFFIAEGIIGLLILHSDKLRQEFGDFD